MNGQSRVVHLTVGEYAVLVSDGLLVDGPGWVAKQLDSTASADVNTEGLDFVDSDSRVDLLENKVVL